MKWGILATGNIAGKFAETVGKMEQEEQIAAVGSRSPERGKEFAERYGIPAYYASYEELLADSQVEAVYVATPNRLHFEDCKRCLEAGKHVLCENRLLPGQRTQRSCTVWQRRRGYFSWRRSGSASCLYMRS